MKLNNYTYKLFTEPDCKITQQLLSFLEKEEVCGTIIDLTSAEANIHPESFKILKTPTLILYNNKEIVDHIFSIEDLKDFMTHK